MNKMNKKDLTTHELENLDLIDKYDDPLSGYSTLGWKDYTLLYVVGAFIITFIIWANIATVDELARGSGRIIPSSEVQVIQSLEGGIIEAFHVKEGEHVKAGQPLIQMSDIAASGEYQANLKRALVLETAIARLTAEAEGTPLTFPERLERNAPDIVKLETSIFKANQDQAKNQKSVLEQQLKQRQQEVIEIQEQMNGLQKIYDISKQELTMIQPLAERGTVSQVELLQLEGRVAVQESELNNLSASRTRINAAVTEAQDRIAEQDAALIAGAQQQIAERSAELVSLKETLATFEDRSKRTEIKSPVYGIVKDISVTTVGGVVQPAQAIMEIVPLDDQLIIEANISPNDIAFIHPNQSAKIKLTAYDYTVYGDINATVRDISADTITNDNGDSFYRVRLYSEMTALHHKGQDLPIIPGMIANVDILTGEKTVMNYLLKPFKKTLDNALHER